MIEYTLTLVIATILLGALVSTTAGIVDDQHDSAIRSELEILGQGLAADLMTVDRLVETGGSTVELETAMPTHVAGSSYGVEIDATESEIILESHDPEISTTVSFDNTTPVEPVDVGGGDLVIVLEDDHVEVRER